MHRLSISEIKHWRDAVRQWNQACPPFLNVALKDWTTADRSKLRSPSVFSNRKTIALEYARLGEEEFLSRLRNAEWW